MVKSPPLHILCFVHAPDLGGVERAALRLCRAWSTRCDVTVALGRDPQALPDLGAARLIAAPRLPFTPSWCETIWMVWLLWRILRRERPDVIFCPGNSYAGAAVGLRLLLGHRCPPILAKISNDLDRPDLPLPFRVGYHLWCRVQGRMIDGFVALSPEMRVQIARIARAPASRVAVADNPALDDAMLATLTMIAALREERATPGRRFVTAGRLVTQKNHALMIEAFARGAGSNDALTIFGDGPLRDALTRQIEAAGLTGRVHLAGRAETPCRWTREGDIFLLSSRYEGLPAVAVEALAAGMPVIATDCCASLRALLDDPRLGALVPADDADALAAAIAAADARAFDRVASRARAARYTVGAAAPAMHAQLVRLAASHRDAAPFLATTTELPA